jgi:hypothetical protein
MVGWGAQTPRGHVVHRFVKRRGARVEDMEQSPRTFSARLHFIGPSAAKDYNDFKADVADNPRGDLVHPIAGRWRAFCQGPDENVDFERAVNEIQVNCSWVEDELDAKTPRDVPDVATSAQNASAKVNAMEQGVAKYVAAMGRAEAVLGAALAQIDALEATLDEVEDPINEMAGLVRSVAGSSASLVARVTTVADKSAIALSDLRAYIDSATDLFNGSEHPVAQFDSANTLLGVAVMSCETLEAAMSDASPSPAGAADAVGDTEEALSSSYILAEALAAARPPTILITVTELTDLITLCVSRYGDAALSRASDVMALNSIPNPAAIPAGTRLLVPSR